MRPSVQSPGPILKKFRVRLNEMYIAKVSVTFLQGQCHIEWSKVTCTEYAPASYFNPYMVQLNPYKKPGSDSQFIPKTMPTLTLCWPVLDPN